MADEVAAPAPAPAPAPAAAPAVAASVAAAASPSQAPASSPNPAPVASPAAAAPAAASSASVDGSPGTGVPDAGGSTPSAEAPKAVEPSILGAAPPEATAAPITDPAATTAPVETQAPEGQSVDPAPPPAYDPFQVPEAFGAPDAERLGTFTNMLGELESKAGVDHATMQQFGQQLVDYHLAEIQRFTDSIMTRFDQQKTEWRQKALADSEIGGNRFQTSVNSAIEFIRNYGGSPAQQQELRSLMDQSGVGNHPAMIRIFANAGSKGGEPGPLAATRPAAAKPKGKVEAMYGGKTA